MSQGEKSNRVGILLVFLLITAGVVGTWILLKKNPANNPAGTPKIERVTAIAVATITQGSLPIYIDALGTVTALNTVTVKSRVDGELQKIHFTEGQIVKAGDLLAEIDPRPFQVQLMQAEGQLARDTASLTNARADAVRYEGAREAVTQQQIDNAEAAVAQFEGAVETDKAQVADAKLQLTYCKITAPIDGTVGLRLVDQGNMIHASDAGGIVVITQLQPIAVVFSIPEKNLQQILKKNASGSKPSVEAYDSDFKEKLSTGTLAALDNQIDVKSRTLKIKALFENADRLLYPNQFVNVRLTLGSHENVIIAPTSAIQRSPDGAYAFVVKNDTVEMRAVVAGIAEGAVTVIEHGLEAGEIVVTDGVDKLQNGSKVRVRSDQGKGSASISGK